MKIFVAILVLIACVLADDEFTVKNGEQLKQIRDDCLKENPLSTEQIAKLKTFEFPNEVEVRKFLQCTAEKMGIFCPDQGYHADRIAKQFKMDMEEADVKKLADECIAKFPKGDKTNDVYAYEVHGCLMRTVVGEKSKAYLQKHQQVETH